MARNQNVQRTDGELGPSWWDVGEYARELHSLYHVSTEFALVPPVRRLDGKGYSAWVAVATVRSRGTDKGWSHSVQASFGSGGAAKTAPAALHALCYLLHAACEERKQTAAQQAAF